jgi:hypothetical protein
MAIAISRWREALGDRDRAVPRAEGDRQEKCPDRQAQDDEVDHPLLFGLVLPRHVVRVEITQE